MEVKRLMSICVFLLSGLFIIGEFGVVNADGHLECPEVPDGEIGLCVEECTVDSCTQEGEKCCSNGCGHVCKPGVPVSDIPRKTPSSGLFAIDDAAIVLIGMGGVIVLLVIIIIVSLCYYGQGKTYK